MNKYEKFKNFTEDFIEVCKKHNVSLLHAPGMIKKRGNASKLIKEHSMMHFFVLDCSKKVVDSDLKSVLKAEKEKKEKLILAGGSKAVCPNNTVTIKLSKNRYKHD